MVLSQQGVRAVGDAHGDDAHAADHHHGDVNIGKDGHDSSSCKRRGNTGSTRYHSATPLPPQRVSDSPVASWQIPIENPSVPRM